MEKKTGEVEIDLVKLVLFLLRRWKILVAAALVGGIISSVLYFCTVTPSYKASSELYMTNTDNVISLQDLQLNNALTADYKEIFYSRTVLKKVIKDQNLNFDYTHLQRMMSISNPSDTHCIIVSVTADTPEAAISITNSLVKYGIDQVYRIVGKDEPTVIDVAEADAVDVIQPSLKKYGLIGVMGMLLVTCGIFALQFILDTTIKTVEDIEESMGLNVLAIVPEDMNFKAEKTVDKANKKGRGTKQFTEKRIWSRVFRRIGKLVEKVK